MTPRRSGFSWRDRLLEIRSRLLASQRFQRSAMRVPLVRGIARRRARRLFDLCAGFVYSQVLLACVRLRVFEVLAEGPQSVEALSGRLDVPPEATRRLLDAAESLELVERRSEDRFGLGALGAAVVGNGAVAAMVEHHPMLYRDLADPVALLRGEQGAGELARYWPYAAGDAPSALDVEQVAAYSALMSASQSLVADQVLDAYPIERHRCLLDVAGGDGSFIAAAAARAPELRLMLFDLPAVIERARTRLGEQGLSARVTLFGGDFSSDPLPTGADLVSLVRVIHDHDDHRALELLRAVRRVLPDEGTLLLAEPMSGTSGAEPIGAAYFGFYLLAMGSGRARTPRELMELLGAAGFGECRLVRTRMPMQARLIVARPAVRGVGPSEPLR